MVLCHGSNPQPEEAAASVLCIDINYSVYSGGAIAIYLSFSLHSFKTSTLGAPGGAPDGLLRARLSCYIVLLFPKAFLTLVLCWHHSSKWSSRPPPESMEKIFYFIRRRRKKAISENVQGHPPGVLLKSFSINTLWSNEIQYHSAKLKSNKVRSNVRTSSCARQ
jgi:hypothetical protein